MHIPCDKSTNCGPGSGICSAGDLAMAPFTELSSCNECEGKGQVNSRKKKKVFSPALSDSCSASSSSSSSSEQTAGTKTTVPLFSCMYLPSTEKCPGSQYQKQPFLHSSSFASPSPGASGRSYRAKKDRQASDSVSDVRVKDASTSVSARDTQLPPAKAPTAFTINHFADIVPTQKAPKRQSEASIYSRQGPSTNGFGDRFHSAAVAAGQSLNQRNSTSGQAASCKSNLIWTTGSIIYALSLVILSCFFYLLDLTKKTNGLHQVFNSLVCIIGVTWLVFLHWDIQRYKLYLVKSIVRSSHSELASNNEDGELDLHPVCSRKPSAGTTLTLVTRSSSSSDADISSSYATGTRQLRPSPSHCVARDNPSSFPHRSAHLHREEETISTHQSIHSQGETMTYNSIDGSLFRKWPNQWYSFLRGSKSGSFYLKCGMAAFCFGHIIHEGLRVGHQIYYLAAAAQSFSPTPISSHLNSSSPSSPSSPSSSSSSGANFNADSPLSLSSVNHSSSASESSLNNSSLISGCFDPKYLILHLIRPFFSFYQLFILFKYSNLIINKNRKLASFALMHLIATSINFWFGTIVDDAIDFYLLHHTHTGDTGLQLVNEPVEASASPLPSGASLRGAKQFIDYQDHRDHRDHLHSHQREESTLLPEESVSRFVATKFFANSPSGLFSQASSPSPTPASLLSTSARLGSKKSNLFDLPVNLMRVDTYTRQSHSTYQEQEPSGQHLHLLHRKPVQMTINYSSPALSVSDITHKVNGTITLRVASDTAREAVVPGEKSRATLGDPSPSKGTPGSLPLNSTAGATVTGLHHRARKEKMATNTVVPNEVPDLISDETVTLASDSAATVSGPLASAEEEDETSSDQVPVALVDVTNETFASPPVAPVSISSSSSLKCTGLMPMVFTSSKIFPYMYPFSIEFYLCLAFFWFILWSHIGHQSMSQQSLAPSFGVPAQGPFGANKGPTDGDMSSRFPLDRRREQLASRRGSRPYYLPFSGHRSRSSSNGTNWSFHSSPSQALAASTCTHERFNCHSDKVTDAIEPSAASMAPLPHRQAASISGKGADGRCHNSRSTCSSSSHSMEARARRGQSIDSAEVHSFPRASTASRSDFICDSGLTSSIVITADCHSASKGLFAGFFVLTLSLVLLILFFISINSSSSESWTFPTPSTSSASPLVAVDEGQVTFALYIFHSQELLLNAIILLGTTYCYFIFTRRLTLRSNFTRGTSSRLDSIHLKIDSGLLILPIPFYFFSSVLSIASELAMGPSWVRVFLLILAVLAVIFQSVFIIDAFDRCLTPQLKLRNKKPAREVVTLLLITNLTAWIVYTFQFKAVETLFFTSETNYYGSTTAFVLSHATLPLMLFYKFHASVCLAEIWKNSYSSVRQASSR